MRRRFLAALALSTVASTVAPLPVTAQAILNSDHVLAVKCIYDALHSNAMVESIGVYRVDGMRSAVEFDFRDAKYGVIRADIELRGTINGKTGFNMGVFRGIPDAVTEDKGWRSGNFVGNLLAGNTCPLVPALDDVFPLPPPRSEWQRVAWPAQTPEP